MFSRVCSWVRICLHSEFGYFDKAALRKGNHQQSLPAPKLSGLKEVQFGIFVKYPWEGALNKQRPDFIEKWIICYMSCNHVISYSCRHWQALQASTEICKRCGLLLQRSECNVPGRRGFEGVMEEHLAVYKPSSQAGSCGSTSSWSAASPKMTCHWQSLEVMKHESIQEHSTFCTASESAGVRSLIAQKRSLPE